MNGFEPLRRRIIDYTEAGQWSEVYDGPLEDCESEKLKAENARLQDELEFANNQCERAILELIDQQEQLKAENAKLRELLQRTWNAFHDATAREFETVKNELRELGIEVDND